MSIHFTNYVIVLFTLLACENKPSLESQNLRDHVKSNPDINLILDSLKNEYAPDGRVALFQIQLKKTKEGKEYLIGETTEKEAYDKLHSLLSDGFSMDSVLLLPIGEFKETPFAIVNISTANIRADSRHSSELSTQATLGTPIKVFKRKGGWFYIQTPDGYLGWLNEGTFVLLTPDEFNRYKGKEKYVFIEDMGKIYEEPNNKSASVSDLTLGNILVSSKLEDSFVMVELPDGRRGYVEKEKMVSWNEYEDRFEVTREDLIQTAKDLLGRPYLWGGTSSKAMDCSGFTKTVFLAHHMILPRDASQQVRAGEDLTSDINELSQVNPGDFLFFGRVQDGRERVTHVGIYLGNGRMIHAGDGKVQVQSLDPRHPDYIAKRRQSFLRAKDMLSKAGSNGVIKVNDSPWYN